MKIKTSSLMMLGLGLGLSLSASINAQPLAPQHIQHLGPITSDLSANNDQQTAIHANLINQLRQQAEQGKATDGLSVFGQSMQWQSLGDTQDQASDGTRLFKLQLSTQRFTQGKLTLKGLDNPALYINGQLQTGADGDSGHTKYGLKLENGDYDVFVIASTSQDNGSTTQVEFDWQGDSNTDQLAFYQYGERRVYPEQLYDSQTISHLSIAPNGKQMIWNKRHFNDTGGDKAYSQMELLSLPKQRVLYRWQGALPSSLAWSPDNQQLAYLLDGQIQLFDRDSKTQRGLTDKLTGVSGLSWYGNDSLIFNWNKSDDSDNKLTKHYRSLEDRWAGWRDNSQVYQLDIQSGLIRQLTKADSSHDLLDIDQKAGTLLLSRSLVDYKQPAHILSELLELEISSQKLTSLGQYRTFNTARYSSEGIYILAGPSFHQGAGEAVPEGMEVNNYDSQLYLMDDKQQITALSKTFDPSITRMSVLKNDDLVLNVIERDSRQLYHFDISRNRYKKLNTGIDIVESFDVAKGNSPRLIYKGTSATKAQQAYSMSLKTGKRSAILDSADTYYGNSKLGELQEWNFTNQRGEEIAGRMYLPTNFDSKEQYPLLVYYYGGTSPVSRAFTGRYPFNLWAAQGYVVYVLQPAGATGFGQTFSGRHVNAWGKDTAEDILLGTQEFVKAHPFVDPKRIGNLGASYGGFTTMYLATKTDMFAASLSHAGISNLSNYWGYGWWGYAYSGVASKGSFPWNNKPLYVEQSPLYHADKITTPLLLIHGDQDTNVPVSESHSMYTALKLLGKEVDLIEFKGQDHQINRRTERLKWWDTVLAYFDKHLKDQPEWWNELYPHSNQAQ